jgi:nitric oxide reductase NorE protein
VKPEEDASAVRHLPGEEGVWVLIGGDLVVFSLLFGLFLYYRGQSVAVFEQSQVALNRGFGLLNTVILLTSSLFVATAVTSARQGFHARAGRLLAAAIVCGIGFGISKTLEYAAKFKAGIIFNTNDFFMFYFMLTGIHMVHVIFATGVLFYLWGRTRGAVHSANYVSVMEAGGVFWHMVDLLWVVLFALLYLL